MNRFRKLGFIRYAGGVDGALQVHSSPLNVILHIKRLHMCIHPFVSNFEQNCAPLTYIQ